VSAEELSLFELERIALSAAYTDGSASRGVRLSLAGAQGKLPVVHDSGRFFLPLGNTPSTHLVKFENPSYRHLPENEVWTTALFKRLGLPCVTTALHRFGSGRQRTSACCVTRYDRLRNGHRVRRLHQEDLCQALGLSSHEKYEADGGPSFATLYRCVQRHSREPFVDTRVLVDWWLACWLCGNSDAHAKNLSLLYHEIPGDESRALRLAPFYDLVCTRAYDKLDPRLATRIGRESAPGQIGEAQLRVAAADLGVRAGFLVARARELSRLVPDAVAQVAAEQREQYGALGVYERSSRVAKTQARRALTLLAAG
jgi:serine/threonine-protein kinase HipA